MRRIRDMAQLGVNKNERKKHHVQQTQPPIQEKEEAGCRKLLVSLRECLLPPTKRVKRETKPPPELGGASQIIMSSKSRLKGSKKVKEGKYLEN